LSGNKQIAVDVMGGDGGAAVTVPAALKVLQQHQGLMLHLVGDENEIQPYLATYSRKELLEQIKIVHTQCAVSADDIPSKVLREKTKSSMYMAVELVQQSQAQACVSAGNTGALLMSGRHLLKTIPGIEKPAIIAIIPAATTHCYLLDVGANVDCKAEQLFQFAVMGSVLAESLDGLTRARVGLLNIGAEEYKGSEQVQLAANLLETSEAINYIGFVEGSALYDGNADVVVCDGFVGNVTIKSSAGVVNVINDFLDEGISSDWYTRICAQLLSPLLSGLRRRINPSQFNGASLLGLQGSIVKSHGNANIEGFAFAIEQAIREADNNVPGLIAEKVAKIISLS